MQNAKVYRYTSIQNDHLIASEKQGLARRMSQRHRTSADKALRERIRQMSVLETIN